MTFLKNGNMSKLIGISGKAGSGKDLIARIIQYLVYQNSHKEFKFEGNLSELLKSNGLILDLQAEFPLVNIFLASGYKSVKFGDKLKDMVCLLLGCSRQDLEDRDFKEKELGEEWWYYKGGSNNFIIPYLPGDNTDSESLVKPTPRLLLQLLGTECGRQILHPNLWVLALIQDYKCDTETQEYPKWIITDVRFPNEFKAIKDRGGINIRVERFQRRDFVKYVENGVESIETYRILNCLSSYCTVINSHENGSEIKIKDFSYNCLRHSDGDKHESETALDNCEDFDYTIYNVGSIEDLVEKVQKILETEKIL